MTKKKQISLYTTEQELTDLNFIREKLERNTESDTIRAMIRMVKKILKQNIAIETMQTQK